MFTLRKRTISRASRQLADSFAQEINHADEVSVMPVNRDAKLTASAGNPNFVAQFDIQVILKFWSVAAGAYTAVTAAALLAAEPTLANNFMPVFLFGNSDYSGSFKNLRQLFPTTVWAYDNVFIYGQGYNGTIYGVLDATIKAQLQPGDLVISLYGSPGATDYIATVIIRCTQTGYGSLLDALNSNKFQTNMVRYNVPSSGATDLAQYDNQLRMTRMSIFGKRSDDFASPNSFKIPEQQQANIIDVPLKVLVDKEAAIGTYMNYNVANFTLSFFVNVVDKI